MGTGRNRDALRQRAQERLGDGPLSVDAAAEFFDTVVRDPAFNDNARMRARLRKLFRDEANSVADLSHPNIVSILDYGDHQGVPFLTMQFVEGRTLLRVIQRQEPLTRIKRLQLMEDLCAGLGFAHKKDIVHRDIKPANLIIDSATDTLKVLDFGVVRRLQASAGTTTATTAIGTFTYMSPEQTLGSASLDRRSDIFSVGAVFYELLALRKAFPPGDNISELITRIQREPPEPLSRFVADLPPTIERIVNKALEKEAERRYQDLTEMQRDIQRVRLRLELEDEGPSTRVIDRGETTLVSGQAAEQQVRKLLQSARRASASGDDHAVVELCNELLKLDSSNASGLELRDRALARQREAKLVEFLNQAEQFIDAGDLQQALVAYDGARTIADTDARVVGLAARLEGLRQAARRARELASAIEQARAAIGAGDLNRADEALARALTLDPEAEAPRRLQEEVAGHREVARRAEQARGLVAQAGDALAAGNLERADAAASEAAQYGLFADELQSLSEQIATERDRRAREARERAEAERAQVIAARVQAAEDALLARRFDDALAAARAVQEIDSENAAAADVMGRTLLAVQQEQEEHERHLLEQRADEAIAAADASFARGDRDAALKFLTDFTPANERVRERLKALLKERARLEKIEKRAAEERQRQEAARRAAEAKAQAEAEAQARAEAQAQAEAAQRRVATLTTQARQSIEAENFVAADALLPELRQLVTDSSEIRSLEEAIARGRRAVDERNAEREAAERAAQQVAALTARAHDAIARESFDEAEVAVSELQPIAPERAIQSLRRELNDARRAVADREAALETQRKQAEREAAEQRAAAVSAAVARARDEIKHERFDDAARAITVLEDLAGDPQLEASIRRELQKAIRDVEAREAERARKDQEERERRAAEAREAREAAEREARERVAQQVLELTTRAREAISQEQFTDAAAAVSRLESLSPESAGPIRQVLAAAQRTVAEREAALEAQRQKAEREAADRLAAAVSASVARVRATRSRRNDSMTPRVRLPRWKKSPAIGQWPRHFD